MLEQSAELISVSLDEFLTEENIRPLVVVGKYLSQDHKSNLQTLTDRIYRTGNTLLLAPPFGDVNIGQYLNTPVAIHAIRRQTQNTCRLIDKQWSGQIAETTKIRSDHHIETALTAGVTCLDDNEKPVLIRYQPSNTQGAVFISGLQLLSYSAVSDESDRLKLIELIIDWRPMHLKEDTNAIEHQDFAPTINKSDLVNTILAIAAANNPSIDTLKEIAIKFLGINISDDRLNKILSYLQSEKIIIWDALSQNFMVSKDLLSQMIEDFGVHAYARELSELFRENTEDLI